MIRRPLTLLKLAAFLALPALVLWLSVGFALPRFVEGEIRDKALHDAASRASRVTAPQVADRLPFAEIDQPLEGLRLARFDQFVRSELLVEDALRLDVLNANGVIVYSTEEQRIGTQVAPPPAGAGLDASGHVVEVNVPLIGGADTPPAVLAVYEDYGPTARHIANVQTTIFIGVAATVATLYIIALVLGSGSLGELRRRAHDEKAHLQRRIHETRTSCETTVSALLGALGLRDNANHGDTQRLRDLACALAWQMGLRKEEARQIEMAVIFHDIGKMGVAEDVLRKPSALNEAEWAEMKRHSEMGFQIIRTLDSLKDVARIVHAHHERFDGQGYPRGLKRDEIPLGARIFAVVDSYHAMTMDRPYRRAMPHSKAITEIVRNALTQFDPEVVQAFLDAERRGLIDGNGSVEKKQAVNAPGATAEV